MMLASNARDAACPKCGQLPSDACIAINRRNAPALIGRVHSERYARTKTTEPKP
jgi:hypothetical protein